MLCLPLPVLTGRGSGACLRHEVRGRNRLRPSSAAPRQPPAQTASEEGERCAGRGNREFGLANRAQTEDRFSAVCRDNGDCVHEASERGPGRGLCRVGSGFRSGRRRQEGRHAGLGHRPRQPDRRSLLPEHARTGRHRPSGLGHARHHRPENRRDQTAAGDQVGLGQSDHAGDGAEEGRQVPLGPADGCRRRRLHLELRLQQGERHLQLRAAGFHQERGEDRPLQGAHQPAQSLPARARQSRRPRLHHAEGPLRQGAREARRQEGLRRRAAQRHRPLPDYRGQARPVDPDGEEPRLLQGRATRAIPPSPRSCSAPSRTPTRAPPSS